MARKIFSSCLAILFVPIFLVTILVMGIKISALNPDFYLKILDKANFYTGIIQTLPTMIGQSITGDSGTFGLLSNEDIASSLQESINPTWLKENLQKSITSIFNYGTGKSYSIDAIIELKNIKSSFVDNISKKFNSKIASLPTCSDQQLQEIQSQNLDSTSLNCLPTGTNVEELEKQFKDALTSTDESLLKALPDQYNLNEQFNKNPLLLTNIKKLFDYSNLSFYILLTVSLLLLLIIALINMKNISIMLKWISIPVLIAAILTLFSVVLGNFMLSTMTSGLIMNVSGEIKSLVYALIDITTKQFFSFYYYSTAILVVLSVILLVIATKTGSNQETEIKIDESVKK